MADSSNPGVPQLDIRRFDRQSPEDRDSFVADLRSALGEFGFVGIVGHELDDTKIASAYTVLREFFELPTEAKRAYHVEGGGGARGYTPFRVETAKDQVVPDLKEFWHVGRELSEDSPYAGRYPDNLWPTQVEGFESAMRYVYESLDGLGRRVLRAIALGLELDEHWFDDKVDQGNSILRPIHYPPITGLAPGEDAGVRSAAHEDINVITLLVGSGEPGLEILNRKGEWTAVSTIEGTVVCNVGDMLQRLTNHVLPSTTHRVVNPPEPWRSKPRYSIPFFLHPNADFLIETLPGCVSDDNPNRYDEPISADAYLQERLREIGLT